MNDEAVYTAILTPLDGSHDARTLLLALATIADRSWRCDPGKRQMVEATGLPEKALGAARSALVRSGYLQDLKQGGYRLVLPEEARRAARERLEHEAAARHSVERNEDWWSSTAPARRCSARAPADSSPS